MSVKLHGSIIVTYRCNARLGGEFTFEPHSLTAIEIEGRVANAEFSEKVQ